LEPFLGVPRKEFEKKFFFKSKDGPPYWVFPVPIMNGIPIRIISFSLENPIEF